MRHHLYKFGVLFYAVLSLTTAEEVHSNQKTGDFDEYVYYQGVQGRPGIDFPVFARIPRTAFSCKQVPSGYYADLETDCQVFHICNDGSKISFLCPNGTIFQQSDLICEWWFKVNCTNSPSLYEESAEQLLEETWRRKENRRPGYQNRIATTQEKKKERTKQQKHDKNSAKQSEVGSGQVRFQSSSTGNKEAKVKQEKPQGRGNQRYRTPIDSGRNELNYEDSSEESQLLAETASFYNNNQNRIQSTGKAATNQYLDSNHNFGQYSSKDLKPGSNRNSNQNYNRNSNKKSDQNSGRRSNNDQNSNQRSSGASSNRNLNRNSNEKFNQNLKYSNQQSNRYSTENPNQHSNQYSNQNSNQGYNQNSNRDSNKYFNQDANRYSSGKSGQDPNDTSNDNSNRHSNQNSNENSNHTSRQKSSRDFDRYTNKDFDPDSNQHSIEKPNQNSNENANQNSYQYSDGNSGYNSDQNADRTYNQKPIPTRNSGQQPIEDLNQYSNEKSNRNSNRYPTEGSNRKPNDNFNQYQNRNSSQNSNDNPNANSNRYTSENSNYNSDRYSTQGFDRNTNRNSNQHLTGDLNLSSNQHSSENSSDFNQYSVRNLNGDSNRYSNEKSNQNSNKNYNRNPNETSNRKGSNQVSNSDFNGNSNAPLENPKLASNQYSTEKSNQKLNNDFSQYPSRNLNGNLNPPSNEKYNRNTNRHSNDNSNDNSVKHSNDNSEQHSNSKYSTQNFDRNRNHNSIPNRNSGQYTIEGLTPGSNQYSTERSDRNSNRYSTEKPSNDLNQHSRSNEKYNQNSNRHSSDNSKNNPDQYSNRDFGRNYNQNSVSNRHSDRDAIGDLNPSLNEYSDGKSDQNTEKSNDGFDRNLNSRSNGNYNQNSNEKSNDNPDSNLNRGSGQNTIANSDRNYNRNSIPNRNSDQETTEDVSTVPNDKSDDNLDQYSTDISDQNLNRKATGSVTDETSDQYSTDKSNNDFNRYSDQDLDSNSNRHSNERSNNDSDLYTKSNSNENFGQYTTEDLNSNSNQYPTELSNQKPDESFGAHSEPDRNRNSNPHNQNSNGNYDRNLNRYPDENSNQESDDNFTQDPKQDSNHEKLGRNSIQNPNRHTTQNSARQYPNHKETYTEIHEPRFLSTKAYTTGPQTIPPQTVSTNRIPLNDGKPFVVSTPKSVYNIKEFATTENFVYSPTVPPFTTTSKSITVIPQNTETDAEGEEITFSAPYSNVVVTESQKAGKNRKKTLGFSRERGNGDKEVHVVNSISGLEGPTTTGNESEVLAENGNKTEYVRISGGYRSQSDEKIKLSVSTGEAVGVSTTTTTKSPVVHRRYSAAISQANPNNACIDEVVNSRGTTRAPKSRVASGGNSDADATSKPDYEVVIGRKRTEPESKVIKVARFPEVHQPRSFEKAAESPIYRIQVRKQEIEKASTLKPTGFFVTKSFDGEPLDTTRFGSANTYLPKGTTPRGDTGTDRSKLGTPVETLSAPEEFDTVQKPKPFELPPKIPNESAFITTEEVTESSIPNYRVSSARPFALESTVFPTEPTVLTPSPSRTPKVYEHVTNMLNTIRDLIDDDKNDTESRTGLVVPPSAGPQTLHSLAVYFANALDGVATENDDEGTTTTTEAEYDDRAIELLSIPTLNRYKDLFKEEQEEEEETTTQTATEDTNDLEGQHTKNGVVTPRVRQLAQVFTKALSSYLDDPEMFRKYLKEARPTEPSRVGTTQRSADGANNTEEDELLNYSDADIKPNLPRLPTTPSASSTWGYLLAPNNSDHFEHNSLSSDGENLESADSQSFVSQFNNYIKEKHFGGTTTPLSADLPKDHWTTSKNATDLWRDKLYTDPQAINEDLNEKTTESPRGSTEIAYEIRSLPKLELNSTQVHGILIDFINTTKNENGRLNRILSKLNTSQDEFLAKMREIEQNPLTRRLILLLISECANNVTEPDEKEEIASASTSNYHDRFAGKLSNATLFDSSRIAESHKHVSENSAIPKFVDQTLTDEDEDTRALELLNSLYTIASRYGK